MILSRVLMFLNQYNLSGLKEIFKYILIDMTEPIYYLILGVVVGAVIFVISLIINTLLGRNPISARSWAYFLFSAYLIVLIQMVFLSRAPGSRTAAMNLTLFGTWGSTPQSHAYVIENILLFVPFGFLFPICVPRLRGISNVFCLSLFLSVGIETVQYITGRGYCQLDDVVMNTLGALIGCVVFHLCYGIYLLFHRGD